MSGGEEKAGVPAAAPASSPPAAGAPASDESIAEMNARHLKVLRAIQGKALEALRGGQFKSAEEAASALLSALNAEQRLADLAGLPKRRRYFSLRIR